MDFNGLLTFHQFPSFRFGFDLFDSHLLENRRHLIININILVTQDIN